MKKKLLIFLMILTMGILSGCGMTEEEAAEYVKASLDAAYKGEFEDFVKITDSTPEGAQAIYEENIIHTMEAAGFADMELSDELAEKYNQLFHDFSKAVNYTVGEAKENKNNGYDVSVTIYPMTSMGEIIEEDVTKELVSRIEKMEKYPNEKKITEMTFEIIYEMLSEKVNEPTYDGQKVVQIVSVHKNENGQYYISEEDMLALDNALFNHWNK